MVPEGFREKGPWFLKFVGGGTMARTPDLNNLKLTYLKKECK